MEQIRIRQRVAVAVALYRMRQRQTIRRTWCRKLFQERNIHGHHIALLPTMREEDPDLFFNFTRMSPTQFDVLLSLVEQKLTKAETHLRHPISASERLEICLRFLATGATYADLSSAFRVGKSSVCMIVHETCKALIDILQPLYLKPPSSKEDWEAIAMEFVMKWHFPNCVGALDGKHIAIQAPPNSGSSFVNYKGFHSIVLMAACDASYSFTFVDVGNFGRISDGGVFGHTDFAKKLRNDPSFLPSWASLPGSKKSAPYVFVADEAFPLHNHLLRPYPGHFLERAKRVFNYRLSRARRCIENAFGILSSRWRVLQTTMRLSPENATLVTLACCCLHNFLLRMEKNAPKNYCPLSYADCATGNGSVNEGAWRSEECPLSSISTESDSSVVPSASEVREIFLKYFNEEGAVPWQINK